MRNDNLETYSISVYLSIRIILNDHKKSKEERLVFKIILVCVVGRWINLGLRSIDLKQCVVHQRDHYFVVR